MSQHLKHVHSICCKHHVEALIHTCPIVNQLFVEHYCFCIFQVLPENISPNAYSIHYYRTTLHRWIAIRGGGVYWRSPHIEPRKHATAEHPPHTSHSKLWTVTWRCEQAAARVLRQCVWRETVAERLLQGQKRTQNDETTHEASEPKVLSSQVSIIST
jgi:hypothetical protein